MGIACNIGTGAFFICDGSDSLVWHLSVFTFCVIVGWTSRSMFSGKVKSIKETMRKENVFTEIKGKAEKWDFSTVAAKLIPVKIGNKNVDEVTITFPPLFSREAAQSSVLCYRSFPLRLFHMHCIHIYNFLVRSPDVCVKMSYNLQQPGLCIFCTAVVALTSVGRKNRNS